MGEFKSEHRYVEQSEAAARELQAVYSCKEKKADNKNRDERESESEGRRGEKNIDYCTNNTGTQC